MDFISRVKGMYLDGYTEREISKKYEVPVSTIEKILSQQGMYHGDY